MVSQLRMAPGRQDHQARLMGFRSPTEDTAAVKAVGFQRRWGSWCQAGRDGFSGRHGLRCRFQGTGFTLHKERRVSFEAGN